MTTLTTIAIAFRKGIIIVIGAVLVITLFMILFSFLKDSFKTVKLQEAPAVATVFGKLPPVSFSEQSIPSSIRFSVETISGTLPEASPTAKVYFFPKKQRGLLTNISTQQAADKLGFTTTGASEMGKYNYREEMRKFIIDPVTKNFSYSYNYVNDGTVFEGTQALEKNSAVARALKFFQNINELPSDYQDTLPKITLLTFNGASFIPLDPSDNEINATAARVDYFRGSIDKIPVVTSKFNEGNIYAIVTKSLDEKKMVIKSDWNYQEIGTDTVGIYPLRSVTEAWNDFLAGKGYIANAGNSSFTKRAIIRDAYLAYYDGNKEETYFMPIYVFIGDNDFIAYANALSSEWTTEGN